MVILDSVDHQQHTRPKLCLQNGANQFPSTILGITFVTNVKFSAAQAGIENMPESNSFYEVSVWFTEIIDKNPEFAKNIDAYRDPNSISVFKRRLRKNHVIETVELIGHIINLSAFAEVVINKHLYDLLQSGVIEDYHYNGLDRTEVLPKLLFAFKEDVLSKRLQVSRLRHLFRLRNEAVHYKASSTKAVRVTVEELIGIWREVGQLLTIAADTDMQQEFESKSKDIIDKLFTK